MRSFIFLLSVLLVLVSFVEGGFFGKSTSSSKGSSSTSKDVSKSTSSSKSSFSSSKDTSSSGSSKGTSSSVSKGASSSGSKFSSSKDSSSKDSSSGGSGSKGVSSSKSSGSKDSSSGGSSSGGSSGSSKSGSSSSGGWWGSKTSPTPKPSPYPTEECVLTGNWLNRDDPAITGDWETFWKFKNDGIDVCPGGDTPQDALCREVDTEIDFDDYHFGHYKYLLCDYRGFLCVDYDSKYYDECPDFEVQFCCPP